MCTPAEATARTSLLSSTGASLFINASEGNSGVPQLQGASSQRQSILVPAWGLCELAAVKAGDVIGAYRLEAPAGASRVGQAWRARHTQLDRRVVLRVVLVPEALQRRVEETFTRRVLPVQQLHSTQLDRLVDSGMTPDGAPFLVTEFLVGEPLEERLHRVGALDQEEAVTYAVEVFQGLEDLHEAQLAHGRVAPARVFLERTETIDGVGTRVRVLDVGLAHVLYLPAELDADPRCLAPELSGGGSPSAAGDVFAAACVLQLMVGGGSLPDGVQPLLAACLDPEPANRPKASEARAALAKVRDVLGGGADAPEIQVCPPTVESGWLDPPEAQAPVPSRAPAPREPPAPKSPPGSGAALGGWSGAKGGGQTERSPDQSSGVASASRGSTMVYLGAAISILAAGGLVYRVSTQSAVPKSAPPPAATTVAASSGPDAAGLMDAAPAGNPLRDGGADASLDPSQAVRVSVTPRGDATFTQVDTGRVLCKPGFSCLLPADVDTRIELEGHEPVVLSGDVLYDRRGGKWRIRLYPKKGKVKSRGRPRRGR